LETLLRRNFLPVGFQFDYVFDWTIIKYQQSQMAVPPHAMVCTIHSALFLHLSITTYKYLYELDLLL